MWKEIFYLPVQTNYRIKKLTSCKFQAMIPLTYVKMNPVKLKFTDVLVFVQSTFIKTLQYSVITSFFSVLKAVETAGEKFMKGSEEYQNYMREQLRSTQFNLLPKVRTGRKLD